MKDLVLYIVKQIVNTPEDVAVEEQRDGSKTNLTLSVNPSDMGIVIGRNGQTIKAIRKLLIIRAIAENIMVDLQLREPTGQLANEPVNQKD